MFTTKIALVLGAGSSLAMGYPLGSDLRRKILSLTDAAKLNFRISTGLQGKPEELWQFVEAFSKSQAYSIDAFLARRPQFADIGKHAIAAILLSCESAERLHKTDHPDHWYQYLFHGLAKDDWESVDFSNLAIVTFNYDRSLEEYLLQSLMASYDKTRQEACSKLKELEIVHVYGALGGAEPWATGYLNYGEGPSEARCLSAAKSIQVIPEGRDDGPSVGRARAILWNADAIAFLGFGFDALNLRRLDSKRTCAQVVQRAEGYLQRVLAATTLGMKRLETFAAYDQLGQAIPSAQLAHAALPPRFVQGGCLEMLRETLVLGDAY